MLTLSLIFGQPMKISFCRDPISTSSGQKQTDICFSLGHLLMPATLRREGHELISIRVRLRQEERAFSSMMPRQL